MVRPALGHRHARLHHRLVRKLLIFGDLIAAGAVRDFVILHLACWRSSLYHTTWMGHGLLQELRFLRRTRTNRRRAISAGILPRRVPRNHVARLPGPSEAVAYLAATCFSEGS
jgi:hypothetical protein